MLATLGKHHCSQALSPKKLLPCILRKQDIAQYDKYPQKGLHNDSAKERRGAAASHMPRCRPIHYTQVQFIKSNCILGKGRRE